MSVDNVDTFLGIGEANTIEIKYLIVFYHVKTGILNMSAGIRCN
jgi:hypothetical protein